VGTGAAVVPSGLAADGVASVAADARAVTVAGGRCRSAANASSVRRACSNSCSWAEWQRRRAERMAGWHADVSRVSRAGVGILATENELCGSTSMSLRLRHGLRSSFRRDAIRCSSTATTSAGGRSTTLPDHMRRMRSPRSAPRSVSKH